MYHAANTVNSPMLSKNCNSAHSSSSIVNSRAIKQSDIIDESDGSLLDSSGILIEFATNEEIYTCDDPTGHIYKVVSGAVRTCQMHDDGRRYIAAFYLRGD